MTDVATPDPCDAIWATLVASLKVSDLPLEERASDSGLLEDEKAVLAYVRLRVKRRTEAAHSRGAPFDALNEAQTAEADADQSEEPVKTPETNEEADIRAADDEGAEATSPTFQPYGGVSLRRPMQGPRKPPELDENVDVSKGGDGLYGQSSQDTGGDAEADTAPKEGAMAKGPSGIPKVGPTAPAQTERLSLPNAKANIAYSAQITGYSNLRMRDDNGSGLILEEDGTVHAEAMAAGEYRIQMGGIKGDKPVEMMVRLSVIARPQDLWTSIPSDQTAALAKPDEDFESMEGLAFMAGASKRGRSHAKEGTYRDDHFDLSYSEETGWHVMVVADGAGSAHLSREGSRVACRVVLHALDTYLPKAVDPHADAMVSAVLEAETEDARRAPAVLRPVVNSLMRAARAAAKKLEERAAQIRCRVSDLSTTLSIAAAKKIGEQWLLISFSIGDGGVGVWDAETGELSLMCVPDSGEYAGQTRFLALDELGPDKDRASRVHVDVRSAFTAFVAMTDGITDPKFETDAGLADPERWRAFWNDDLTQEVTFTLDNADLKEQFFGWLDFWSRGNHDDRTLTVLVPKDLEPVVQAEDDDE